MLSSTNASAVYHEYQHSGRDANTAAESYGPTSEASCEDAAYSQYRLKNFYCEYGAENTAQTQGYGQISPEVPPRHEASEVPEEHDGYHPNGASENVTSQYAPLQNVQGDAYRQDGYEYNARKSDYAANHYQKSYPEYQAPVEHLPYYPAPQPAP
ncbi:hypothetical protein LOTGIDRAFT_167565, partial [Lottia gigantea]